LHVDGRTEGQTDMMKLKVAFRNFANAHKTVGWEKRGATLKPVQSNVRHFKREGTKTHHQRLSRRPISTIGTTRFFSCFGKYLLAFKHILY
jgi:hypothetical protein